jgi:hypothetical protein
MHKVHVYLLYIEYHSVCPIQPNWDPPPPLGTKGGYTLTCGVEGGGSNLDDLRRSLALNIFCGGFLCSAVSCFPKGTAAVAPSMCFFYL